jgi:uncharacterized membrane protein
MFTRIFALWHDLRSSLWALPLAMALVAAGGAILAVHIPVAAGEDPVWFLYSGDAKDAPQFLSNLVTAMITMTTLVVSITIVVLTLAAQQLGPRLIRNFMADRRTQATLGLFIATVVYLLLVLRSTYGATDQVPNLAVTVGTALVLVCLVALLIFVHHLARSIIADTTIDRVGDALDADIKRLLPESNVEQSAMPRKLPSEHGAALLIGRSGYVQTIDHQGLIDIATSAKAVIELPFKPGDHMVQGEIFAWIAPGRAATDKLRDQVDACVALSGERSSVQDLETSIRQLVEVAIRALSPSVADPFTAIAVVDRLTESLAAVMRRGPPQRVWVDEKGKIRLIVHQSSFGRLVDAAFRPIRQHSDSEPAVLIRLVESLGKLMAQADAEQREVLAREIEIVRQTGRRGIPQEEDLDVLEERANAARDG